MLTERQADLDDLIASCRAPNAKRAFAEAVACFRAGAYRACIVATWTAVVFDYVGKLRELELAGNGQAKTILESFENARLNEDVPLSQKLEGAVLKEAAEKFDLLSPIERQDLEDLRRDRNRCAHPSMLTLDDPYQPSAEGARAHLRHAVQHFLSRPPVQGQEAFDRIWADVSSEYFPDSVDAAEERLRLRAVRARASLIRRLATDLVKKLLSRDAQDGHPRFLAALKALTRMQHAEVESLLREKLHVLADLVVDQDLRLLVEFCANYELAWGTIGTAAQHRLATFVQKTDGPKALLATARLPSLWEITVGRLQKVDGETLATLAVYGDRTEPVEELVRRFETESQFKAFSVLRKALGSKGVRAKLSPALAQRLVANLHSNATLKRYMGFSSTVTEVLEAVTASGLTTIIEWQPVYDALVAESFVQTAKKVRKKFPAIAPPEPTEKGETEDDQPHE